MTTMNILRVREPAAEDQGVRILVDGMWPRGLSKDRARVDHWFKDVAPSKQLRSWFGHDPDKFQEFTERYRRELDENDSEDMASLRSALKQADTATLVYDAKDEEHNNAVVLLGWLREHRSGF